MNTALEKLVEKFAGAKLPITYSEFLLTKPRTQTTEHCFVVPHASGDWEDEIESFYGEDEIIDAIEREQMLRDGGAKDIPDAMIPIASNGMGDVLYNHHGNEEAISPKQKFCFTSDDRKWRQEPQKIQTEPSHRKAGSDGAKPSSYRNSNHEPRA
jgi:hypothetical protein